jgi:suppressor of fused protein SUFU
VGDDPEITPGGSRIERHDEALPPETAPPDWAGRELIEEHVASRLGAIETVFHELVSPYVHLDVLIVEATEERPFHWLVTSGMSSRPMPAGEDEPDRLELLIALPADWPLDRESWQDDRYYWPVEMLKTLARMPHEYGFALGPWHTVPNGDPAEPYGPGTKLCGAMIVPPRLTPDEFDLLETPDGPVQFCAIWFLHRDEMEAKLKRGSGEIARALWDADVSEIVEPDRSSALKKKRFGLF